MQAMGRGVPLVKVRATQEEPTHPADQLAPAIFQP
jgi:hypothetical protein